MVEDGEDDEDGVVEEAAIGARAREVVHDHRRQVVRHVHLVNRQTLKSCSVHCSTRTFWGNVTLSWIIDCMRILRFALDITSFQKQKSITQLFS